MAVPKMNVKDIDRYWERLSNNLAFLSGYLQRKAEYGSRVSERGIQGVVLSAAKRIAKERNLNVDLVSSLCQAVALCFPERGFAELAVIREYLRKNNVDIALDTLEIDAIEHTIHTSGAVVTPELDTLLHKYYSDDESVPEVNLVRFLQKYLNLHRELLRACSFSQSGQTIDAIMKQAEQEYETAYRLLPDPIVLPVPQKIKEEIEERLLTFMEYYDDMHAGIYEAII